MSNLTQFNFKSNQVRVEIKDDQPLFCLSDICSILSINRRSSDAFNLKEKGCKKIAVLTKGGKQEVLFIDEPNLYRVIFRSNKKEAIEFQDWVFEEVLPTIRKTGEYSTKINASQKRILINLVDARVKRTGETHQAVWKKSNTAFGINSYHELPANQFDDYVEFVTGMKAIPHQMPTDKIMIDKDTAQAVIKFINMSKILAHKAETTHRNLFELMGIKQYAGVRNDIAAIAYDVGHEFNAWLDDFTNQVKPNLPCNI